MNYFSNEEVEAEAEGAFDTQVLTKTDKHDRLLNPEVMAEKRFRHQSRRREGGWGWVKRVERENRNILFGGQFYFPPLPIIFKRERLHWLGWVRGVEHENWVLRATIRSHRHTSAPPPGSLFCSLVIV